MNKLQDIKTLNIDLNNQVAIVTGAGRGIGRAISLSLAACNAHVVLAARTISQIESVAKEIKQLGGQAIFVPTDISDEDSITNLFKSVLNQFGRLDILVNNAGIGRFSPVKDISASDVDHLLSVNVRGTLLCCREALRIMENQKSGYIINISSVVGFKGYENQAAYTASKHGVVGLTKTLAVEAQKNNIQVSVIHLGGVDTDLARQARPDLDRNELMQPKDIAHCVLFLLSLSNHCAIDEIYIRRRTSKPY